MSRPNVLLSKMKELEELKERVKALSLEIEREQQSAPKEDEEGSIISPPSPIVCESNLFYFSIFVELVFVNFKFQIVIISIIFHFSDVRPAVQGYYSPNKIRCALCRQRKHR